MTLVLAVSKASPSTQYVFSFFVRDPSATDWVASGRSHLTGPSETEFTLFVSYPGPDFAGGGRTSLTGTYQAWVDRTDPTPVATVANTSFLVGLTDRTVYQRTQSVSVKASGYFFGELVNVTIITVQSSSQVFSASVTAGVGGTVSVLWQIPKDATTEEDYRVAVTGASTVKIPPDIQDFNIVPAVVSIPELVSPSSVFQRTEELQVSFQAVYPSGERATTGIGLVALHMPDGSTIILTATYDLVLQGFIGRYKTTPTELVGGWSASMSADGYDDGLGNHGPTDPLSTSMRLDPATLAVSIVMEKTVFVANETIPFTVSVQYPDGSSIQTFQLSAFISLVDGDFNASVPLVFDSALGLWVGAYTSRGDEPVGLWSLRVGAADSASPPNSGVASRAVQIQAPVTDGSGFLSIPLMYFGVLAGVLGAGSGSYVLLKRRRKIRVMLKFDLDAIRAEAEKIARQEFFQSLMEQVLKNKKEQLG